ncbi:bifunctional transcriptional activator/DNA repair enzyme AdaA [Paenibacillaceae bacterium WGS1546]|uniref:bifunctional transcriptional activator/DNA repair enzyme AdaA n=1 Tax=Cohnella sp. WGS1546 TaxID=3366810 RepID=UPI00372D0ABD
MEVSELAEEEILATDEQWRAIVGNDASYDGKFYYAVATTGIFCRPSCRSKPPNRINVRVFLTTRRALDDGFRPCKRCKPTGERLPDEEWIALISAYIDERYMDALPLEKLAEIGRVSPYHLHRTFKRMTGSTPAEYVQRVRIGRAKEWLANTDASIADIGLNVGIPNPSHFATLFKKLTGATPASYRKSIAAKERSDS